MTILERSDARANRGAWEGLGDAWKVQAEQCCRRGDHAGAAERFAKAADCYGRARLPYSAGFMTGQADAERRHAARGH